MMAEQKGERERERKKKSKAREKHKWGAHLAQLQHIKGTYTPPIHKMEVFQSRAIAWGHMSAPRDVDA